MSSADKMSAIKDKFGKPKGTGILGKPPAPEDAPDNLKKAEVIPEAGGALDQMAGEKTPANDPPKSKAKPEPAKPAPVKKIKPNAKGKMPEGYVQLNGRVLKDVRLRMAIASKIHEKEMGEIITEAFELWEAKHS